MSYLFIWHKADHVTDAYHSQAGVVVVAESIEAAREQFKIWQSDLDIGYYNTDPAKCEVYSEAPDVTYELAGTAEPKVHIFPDAGCC